MSLATVFCRANSGIHAALVTVEVHLSRGLPRFHIVGLPEKAVNESKDRVRSAIITSQFEFPIRYITVNLAPADLPKESGRFDLAIAMGILAASKQVPHNLLHQYEFLGELSLTGQLLKINAVLPSVLAAKNDNRTIIIPTSNEREASMVSQSKVLLANHLLDICAYFKSEHRLQSCFPKPLSPAKPVFDLNDIKGQPVAKKALEISAAGKHSLLLVGPPGTGKTMLANRYPSILPELSENLAMEVAAIASLTKNGFDVNTWKQIPFRNPHHTASNIALAGGGRPPQPGEISLAHHGILFLDELPEFKRHVLETLREPLESGEITISRANHQMTFPARFQLIAAMNPCPCGFLGHPQKECLCTFEQIKNYRHRLSGPFLDRIDMHVEVPPIEVIKLTKSSKKEESSEVVRARVLMFREKQYQRQGKCNAELNPSELLKICNLDSEAESLLQQMMQKFFFSTRTYHRILKLALTIADMKKSAIISKIEIAEALRFRFMDKPI